MKQIKFKNFNIELLHKPNLKNSYITIDANQKIIIKSPSSSRKFLLGLLQEREHWIEKQLFKIKSLSRLEMKLEDEVLLYGELYSIDSQEATVLREKLHRLQTDSPQKIVECYNNFYKESANLYITQRVLYFSQLMKLNYKEIKYKKLKSRWGSCSSTKVLTFNTELMKVDKDLIDYVVVHELSHLVHMNHSKDFHAHVEKFLHNSKSLRQKLKAIAIL